MRNLPIKQRPKAGYETYRNHSHGSAANPLREGDSRPTTSGTICTSRSSEESRGRPQGLPEQLQWAHDMVLQHSPRWQFDALDILLGSVFACPTGRLPFSEATWKEDVAARNPPLWEYVQPRKANASATQTLTQYVNIAGLLVRFTNYSKHLYNRAEDVLSAQDEIVANLNSTLGQAIVPKSTIDLLSDRQSRQLYYLGVFTITHGITDSILEMARKTIDIMRRCHFKYPIERLTPLPLGAEAPRRRGIIL